MKKHIEDAILASKADETERKIIADKANLKLSNTSDLEERENIAHEAVLSLIKVGNKKHLLNALMNRSSNNSDNANQSKHSSE